MNCFSRLLWCKVALSRASYEGLAPVASEVFWTRLAVVLPEVDPQHAQEFVSGLGCEHLCVPEEELAEAAGETEFWEPLLRPLTL